MIPEINGRPWFMLIIAKWFPNKRDPKWMLRSISNGVLPVGYRQPKLSSTDLNELGEIRQVFEKAPASAPSSHAFMTAFAAEEILASGELERLAVETVSARRLLEVYEPQDILTDSLLNPVSGIVIDVAREMGIPVTVMLHAHYIQNLKFERLGCDPRVGTQADRFFSWGPITENWLRETGATAVPVRTGNPISGKFTSKPRTAKSKQDNVLLLQYTIAYSDLGAWPHHEYEFFVDMLGALNDLGYANVRLRLHPGVPKYGYYREITDHFGLTCEVNDNGPFDEQIEWADFVIGPVISGAMLEVIASEKRYYPVLMQPLSTNRIWMAWNAISVARRSPMPSSTAALGKRQRYWRRSQARPLIPTPQLVSGKQSRDGQASRTFPGRSYDHLADRHVRGRQDYAGRTSLCGTKAHGVLIGAAGWRCDEGNFWK